ILHLSPRPTDHRSHLVAPPAPEYSLPSKPEARMIRAVESPRSRTLPQLLDEMASRQPSREFIVGAEARLTYAETRTRVRRLAKGLYRLGVRGGEKVALLMNNRTEWLLVDFAVTLLGATLVPISTWSRARE